jgi:hypothetical protein
MTWDERPEEDAWFSVDPKGHREEDEPSRPRRGPSFLSVLMGLVVVAIAVVAWVNHSSEQRATVKPTPTTSTSTPMPSESSSSSTTSPTPEPTVTTVAGARPPLGSTRPWDLVVATASELVRVEMATGRTVRVEVGTGSEHAPMTIVDLGTSILLHPTYDGTGYVVRDDGTVSSPEDRFPGPGSVVPVPGTRLFWLSRSAEQQNRLDLVGADGTVVKGASVTLPSDLAADSARSDGGRALLLEGVDGVYRYESGRFRRITTGQLVGRTPDGVLAQECDDAHRCRLNIVDRDTGSRKDIGPAIDNLAVGSVSPDGRHALLFRYGPDGAAALLVDLGSGRRRAVGQVTGQSTWGGQTSVVWSPDSRWVVTTTDAAHVVGVDVVTGTVTEVPLGDLLEVAGLGVRYR